jgi:multiple RNA-binding domain-containing protein 1
VKKPMSSFAKRKLEALKADKSNAAVWASLFTRADAVASATAERLGMNKADLFAGSAGESAVRLALGETQTLAETTNYFREHGVNLTPPDGVCVRSRTAIVVKNLPFHCDIDKLRREFANYGVLVQFLSPPSHTIALLEFGEVNHAKVAFNALAYSPFGNVPLFLEWAPEGLLSTPPKSAAASKATDDSTAATTAAAADAEPAKVTTTRAHVNAPDEEEAAVERAIAATQERTVFVRNLNFETSIDSLKTLLGQKLGRDDVVSVKIARDAAKKRSAGYAFVELRTRDAALKAYRTLQGITLDSHQLEFQLSKAKAPTSAAKQQPSKSSISAQSVKVLNEKIAVKNIAFEASLDEVRQLFAAFGEIKKLRMPRKQDGSARGFAFVTFATKKEAQSAADALKHVHFYGRHLVIEPASE